MLHIRNSKNDSIFLLEYEGIPTSLTTDFGETIVNGSLCVDTLNENIYQLKSGIWTLVGGSVVDLSGYIKKDGTTVTTSSISFAEGLTSPKNITINGVLTSGTITYPKVSGTVNQVLKTDGVNTAYWGDITDVIDISYSDLYDLYSTNSLNIGKYYRFDYQTKHVIPYTNVINNAPIEKLIVKAVATNKLDKIAYSPSYPNDIIYYRIDDINVNGSNGNGSNGSFFTDGIGSLGNPYFGNPYLNVETETSNYETNPVASRTGRIYYREDTIKRLSAPYDFRNVKFRRWKLTYPFEVTSTYHPFTNMNYSCGDIIVDVSGYIYMARTNFTCNTSIMFLYDTNFFYNITSLLINVGNKSDISSYFNSPIYNKYISSTPDNFVLFSDNTTGVYNLSLQVDNSSYYDFTTFDNDLGGSDTKSRNIESFNCHIENFVPAWLEQVAWEYYPNIVFGDYSNNVKIGQFSENITIQDSCNIKIGSYCKNLFINSMTANLNQTVLEDRNQNIFIDNKNGYDNNSETYFKIGTSNKNILVSNGYNVKIGDGNKYMLLSGIAETKIGSNNNYIYYFGDFTNNLVLNNNIENYNSYLSINISCYDNFIGNKNSNIYIPQNASSNIIGNKNIFINGIRSSITVEGVPITNFNSNKIGDNNANITLAGGGNVVENNVSEIFCYDSVLFNNITFKSNSGKLSFINGANGWIPDFVGTIFDYNKDIFSSQKILNIGLNKTPDILTNMNYNIVKRSDSTIYSQEVNTYTDNSTYTIKLNKLILI